MTTKLAKNFKILLLMTNFLICFLFFEKENELMTIIFIHLMENFNLI